MLPVKEVCGVRLLLLHARSLPQIQPLQQGPEARLAAERIKTGPGPQTEHGGGFCVEPPFQPNECTIGITECEMKATAP
jgi:hypothetical protein